MPINRSPPTTPAPPVSLAVPVQASLHHSCSEPNITNNDKLVDPDCEFINTAHRSKRRCIDSRTHHDDQLANFMIEIKNMFTEFKEEQGRRIDKLYESIEEIKNQNSTIQNSVAFLSKNYDELKDKIAQLEDQIVLERNNSNKYIQILEEKLESLERGARSSCIEIKNIPIKNSETKESLVNTVIKIGSTIHVNIQPFEVKDTFRIGSKDPANRTIIVDFTSNLIKEKFIQMYKKFNRENRKLSTDILGIEGISKPVFVSENLTPKLKRVFFLARDFASTHDFKYCWIKNGKIFLKQKEGTKYFHIKDESDLLKIKSEK